jgi:uncharacterized membrane protein
MKSSAHIKGHPIHPMLIPYPFALLTSATAFDAAARLSGRSELSSTAKHIGRAGLATALLAAVPGIVDYFGTVPRRPRAISIGAIHAILNVSALTCYAIAESQRDEFQQMSKGGLALSLAATGILSYSGWLGGKMVYEETIGVNDERAGIVHLPEMIEAQRSAGLSVNRTRASFAS